MNDNLLKALKLIQEECKECERCIDCPFLDGNEECGITSDSPSNWMLKKREVYF